MGKKRKRELTITAFVIFIAATLFIISTYAWFTSQRKISILNFSGKVQASNSLQISLDAKNWTNEITLGKNSDIKENAYRGNRNISPKIMKPVSTIGIIQGNKKDLTMMRGNFSKGNTLSQIVAMDETLALSSNQDEHQTENLKYPGYIAFDVFLKDISGGDREGTLQLNYESSVQIIEGGNDESGLQNTVRVGFAKYGGNGNGLSNRNATQETILRQTGTGALHGGSNNVYITDVAIWEPNSNEHVEQIVTNNNNIRWSKEDAEAIFGKGATQNTKYTATTQIPTYALKESALEKNTIIQNIYNWDKTDTNANDEDKAFSEHLQKQKTLQTTKMGKNDYRIKEGVQNLVSASDGISKFTIQSNRITRLRIYVWLEGQDVDCIDHASYGGGITLNLGLTKDLPEGTYEEAEM